MNSKIKVLAGGVAAAFVALAYWAVSTVPELPDSTGEPVQHVMSYDGNTISETKNGKVVWELTADSIEMVAETKVATLTNIKCYYYTEDGRKLELKGDKGIYNEATGDVTMEGNIAGKSSDGCEMSCERADWISKDSALKLSGKAHLEKKDDKLKADGDTMESTDGFQKFKVAGKAHIEKGN